MSATNLTTAASTATAKVQAHQQLSIDSNAILCGKKTAVIVHNGISYQLQATKLGKLILTK